MKRNLEYDRTNRETEKRYNGKTERRIIDREETEKQRDRKESLRQKGKETERK